MSAKSLRIAKWMHGSRLPSASTSTCSRSASTPFALVSIVGTMTIVRAVSRHAGGEVEARQPFRRTSWTTTRWTHAIAKSLAGSRTSSATDERGSRRAACMSGVGDGRRRRRTPVSTAIAPRYRADAWRSSARRRTRFRTPGR